MKKVSFKDAKEFLGGRLWRSEFEHVSKTRKVLLHQLRVISLALRGFKEDNVLLRSSALTFYTLISIVPIIAMAFGIAKGFGFEKILDSQIKSTFSSQPEVSNLLIEFSHSFLENTKGGLVAGLGLILLFWSVMKVLNNIELSFNAVWGIKKQRTIIRKFTEYLSIMLVAPLFVMLAGGITVLASSVATKSIGADNAFYLLGPAVRIAIEFIPYVLIWFLFTFLYMAIPNTKVQFKHALIAGIVAGTFFNALEWLYFTFQIGAAQASRVYGSFAALPLFLVWVQSSWIVVLFGCEIAFASQHVNKFIYEKEIENLSIYHKHKISILILHFVNARFTKGYPPMNLEALYTELNLPVRLVQSIIDDLVSARFLAETQGKKAQDICFSPARDLSSMKIFEIHKKLIEHGSSSIPIKNEKEWEAITNSFEESYAKIETGSEVSLSDLK